MAYTRSMGSGTSTARHTSISNGSVKSNTATLQPPRAAESKGQHAQTEHKVDTPTPVPAFALPAISFIAGIIVAWYISQTFWRRFGSHRDRIIAFASTASISIGIFGSIGHALYSATGSDWHPIFDTTTLSWTALIIIGAALPIVTELTVAGVNVKLQEAEQIAKDATELMQNWTSRLKDLLSFIETATSAEEVKKRIRTFLELRAYEALEWIGSVEEDRRLSIWLYDPEQDNLFFFFSNEIRDKKTVEHTFKVGEGIIGAVFQGQEIWNERDAPGLPVWVKIREEKPQYRGIFCCPVNFGKRRLGVVSVDRERGDYFDADHVNVLIAFAEIIGTAIGNEKAQTLLGSP